MALSIAMGFTASAVLNIVRITVVSIVFTFGFLVDRFAVDDLLRHIAVIITALNVACMIAVTFTVAVAFLADVAYRAVCTTAFNSLLCGITARSKACSIV
jgi:hypothetical protein